MFSNKNIVYRWFKGLDKLTIVLTILLIIIGTVLITSASPGIAKKIGFHNHYHFIYHHAINIFLSFFMMIFFCSLNEKQLKYISTVLFFIMIALIIIALTKSSSIKGTRRWINLFGFSLQPSEIIKPTFAIFSAWILSKNPQKYMHLSCCYLFVALLLLMQPDFGMFITFSVTFFSVLFMSRVNIIVIPCFLCIFIVIIAGSYLAIPHVKYRINSFLNPKPENTYQVQKAMDSLSRGGMFGVGPSEGSVKMQLPDAHTDFIFSVAGEEFGLLLTLTIVLLYFLLFTSNLLKLYKIHSEFGLLAGTGIVSYLSAQCLINISVNLNIIPTKGMTLPFISYGGSSMIASGIAVGMLLSVTRRSYELNIRKYHNF